MANTRPKYDGTFNERIDLVGCPTVRDEKRNVKKQIYAKRGQHKFITRIQNMYILYKQKSKGKYLSCKTNFKLCFFFHLISPFFA